LRGHPTGDSRGRRGVPRRKAGDPYGSVQPCDRRPHSRFRRIARRVRQRDDLFVLEAVDLPKVVVIRGCGLRGLGVFRALLPDVFERQQKDLIASGRQPLLELCDRRCQTGLGAAIETQRPPPGGTGATGHRDRQQGSCELQRRITLRRIPKRVTEKNSTVARLSARVFRRNLGRRPHAPQAAAVLRGTFSSSLRRRSAWRVIGIIRRGSAGERSSARTSWQGAGEFERGERRARLQGNPSGPAASLPQPKHVPVELPPQGLFAHRGDRRGDMPLLQLDVPPGRGRSAVIAPP
jgi:hypothetical protein